MKNAPFLPKAERKRGVFYLTNVIIQLKMGM